MQARNAGLSKEFTSNSQHRARQGKYRSIQAAFFDNACFRAC